MAPTVTITQAELLEALVEASRNPSADNARTVEEIVEATGVSTPLVRRALAQYAKAGRLAVFRVQRSYIDGRRGLKPGYTILPAPKGKRKA
jgi:DNA-binding IscR family transcriptional regulator